MAGGYEPRRNNRRRARDAGVDGVAGDGLVAAGGQAFDQVDQVLDQLALGQGLALQGLADLPGASALVGGVGRVDQPAVLQHPQHVQAERVHHPRQQIPVVLAQLALARLPPAAISVHQQAPQLAEALGRRPVLQHRHPALVDGELPAVEVVAQAVRRPLHDHRLRAELEQGQAAPGQAVLQPPALGRAQHRAVGRRPGDAPLAGHELLQLVDAHDHVEGARLLVAGVVHAHQLQAAGAAVQGQHRAAGVALGQQGVDDEVDVVPALLQVDVVGVDHLAGVHRVQQPQGEAAHLDRVAPAQGGALADPVGQHRQGLGRLQDGGVQPGVGGHQLEQDLVGLLLVLPVLDDAQLGLHPLAALADPGHLVAAVGDLGPDRHVLVGEQVSLLTGHLVGERRPVLLRGHRALAQPALRIEVGALIDGGVADQVGVFGAAGGGAVGQHLQLQAVGVFARAQQRRLGGGLVPVDGRAHQHPDAGEPARQQQRGGGASLQGGDDFA